MKTSTPSRDENFEVALSVAERYAAAVGALHEALAAARLAHVGASLVMERQYAFLAIHSVPTVMKARLQLNAAFDLAEADLALAGGDEESSSTDDLSEAEHHNDDSRESTRQKVPSAATRRGEKLLWKADPATWFATTPSSDLVDCQRQFRTVVERATAVAKLQREALDALSRCD